MHIRDRTGLTIFQRGRVLREVSRGFAPHYDHLMAEDGLYQRLVDDGLMVSHAERGLKYALTEDAYRLVAPRPVPHPTYPYEWPFSQLKAAARHILDVAHIAPEYDMALYSADLFSVSWIGGRPVWTDTLAFTRYRDGQPWEPYRQFTAQALATVALAARVEPSLTRLLQIYPDGVPLALASAMLPARTRISPGLTQHIHNNTRDADVSARRLSKQDMYHLLDSLADTVEANIWTPNRDGWEMYADGALAVGTLDPAQRLLREALAATRAATVWDMNAGVATYSRIAANEFGATVHAYNDNPDITELLWQTLTDQERERVQPVWMDWTQPSPGLGWAYRKRQSLAARANADLLVAVGLVHRLMARAGLTFNTIAGTLSRLAPTLIVDFVPPDDPQLIAQLPPGQSAIPDYSQGAFEAAFADHYDTIDVDAHQRDPGIGTRAVYWMERRAAAEDADIAYAPPVAEDDTNSDTE